MLKKNLSKDWIGLADFSIRRRVPFLIAIVGLVVYVAAVVIGAAVQQAMHLPGTMGWLQQIFGATAALLMAMILRSPVELLGLKRPPAGWLPLSLGIGVSIAAVGYVASFLVPSDTHSLTLEMLIYQATAPGIGEELGFRGLWLGLLATAGLQFGFKRAGGWWLLLLAALPFASLHILEATGIAALAIFGYALYAGVVLGWCRMLTGSIWPAVVAHNIANVVSVLVEQLMTWFKS